MPQFARPSADTNNPGSYTDQAGGSASLFATIDESAANDADFIRSPTDPVNAVYVTKLTSLTDPVSSAGHILRARVSTDVASGGNALDYTDELRQGYVNEGSLGTLIATLSQAGVSGTTWQDLAYTLSAAEADAITDYTALYRRIKFHKP